MNQGNSFDSAIASFGSQDGYLFDQQQSDDSHLNGDIFGDHVIVGSDSTGSDATESSATGSDSTGSDTNASDIIANVGIDEI